MLRILPKSLYFQTLFRIPRISQAKMLLPPLPTWIKLERVTSGGVNGSKRERGCSVCGKSFVQSNACNFTKNIECKEFLSDFLPCYANDHVHFISCWFARCSLGEVNNGSYPIPIPGIPPSRCHTRQHAKFEHCSHLYKT